MAIRSSAVLKNDDCSMESELTMSPEQIKNTAESSVEFDIDDMTTIDMNQNKLCLLLKVFQSSQTIHYFVT